jgi:pyruvate dehydrogenase E2 component (dihydrolipoamide acetyltransferase)
MSVSVAMPQLGESVTEGTVTRWLKEEGERVAANEPLLGVSTDKVETDRDPLARHRRAARDLGVANEDETIEVGAQLAVIVEDEGAPGGGD